MCCVGGCVHACESVCLCICVCVFKNLLYFSVLSVLLFFFSLFVPGWLLDLSNLLLNFYSVWEKLLELLLHTSSEEKKHIFFSIFSSSVLLSLIVRVTVFKSVSLMPVFGLSLFKLFFMRSMAAEQLSYHLAFPAHLLLKTLLAGSWVILMKQEGQEKEEEFPVLCLCQHLLLLLCSFFRNTVPHQLCQIAGNSPLPFFFLHSTRVLFSIPILYIPFALNIK